MRLSFPLCFALLAGCGLTLDFDPPEGSADGGRRDGGSDAAHDGGERDARVDADGGMNSGDANPDVEPPECRGSEECEPPAVCVGGRCVRAECGDGDLDALEECDDGNLEDGDGCDADCTWTCAADRECGPRIGCIAAICLDHRCVPQNTNGTRCGDVASEAVCADGVCSTCGNEVLDPDEECDATSGCGTDCRFLCATNLDCDPCERCVLGACRSNPLEVGMCEVCFAGSYVRRDEDGDGSGACDTRECSEFPGCDCDDRDASVFGDREGLHGCGDPAGYVDCGPDADGDGFVSRDMATPFADRCPDELIEVTRYDCYDENAEANPEATRPRVDDRGDESFDWDCDGRETPTSLARAEACDASAGDCSGSGWVRRTPVCGGRGLWQECSSAMGGCDAVRYFRSQSCL